MTSSTAVLGTRPDRAGRLEPPLVAAGIITLPAVVGAASGRITVLGLLATFVVVFSLTLLASAAGARLLRALDSFTNAPVRPPLDAGHAATATALGHVPVARVPAHEAILGTDHPSTDRHRSQDLQMQQTTDDERPVR